MLVYEPVRNCFCVSMCYIKQRQENALFPAACILMERIQAPTTHQPPPPTPTHNPFVFSFRNAAKKRAKEESRPWWFMDTVCDLASVNSDTAKWADTAAHLLSDHFSWFYCSAGLPSFPTASPHQPTPTPAPWDLGLRRQKPLQREPRVTARSNEELQGKTAEQFSRVCKAHCWPSPHSRYCAVIKS